MAKIYRYLNGAKTKHIFASVTEFRAYCGRRPSTFTSMRWYADLETLNELPECKKCARSIEAADRRVDRPAVGTRSRRSQSH